MNDEIAADDSAPLHLFQGYGVELEYMIVDRQTLDVAPITDRVIHDIAGSYLSEIELGDLCWSNELALHVIELKTNGPATNLDLAPVFQSHVADLNQRLVAHGAQLMPTAMHPWMDPDRDLQLWPHEYNPVYESYNRIFDCRGHGWANLQSVHLNLPFADDDEFGRLHAAIRLILPLLPALAASSPIADRRPTEMADYRMHVYRNNSNRVPEVSGQIVPEPVFNRRDYETEIFAPMYRAIRPLDADGILQHEWLNARGAIARFDRQAIEIRVLDIQECPAADVAICALAAGVLARMTDETWTSTADQQTFAVAPLAALLTDCVRDAEQAIIRDPRYLAQFGLGEQQRTAGEIWAHLAEQVAVSPAHRPALDNILANGPLARRITRAVNGDISRLHDVYSTLCECLATGQLFQPASTSRTR